MSNASELAKVKQKNRAYLIAAALGTAVAILFAGLYFYSQRPDAIRNIENPYPMVDLSRSFVAQEHFITNIQPLREKLNKIVLDRKLETASIYFEFLQTGANISVNPDVRVYPASLLKVPTAIAVMRKIEKGEWRLDNKLVLFAGDIDPNYGEQYYKNSIGATFTIEELLKAILIESDNTTHRILIRNLSTEDFALMRDSMGLDEVLDERQLLSVKVYSRVFRALYYASSISREHSEQLLEWLSETSFNDYLQSGLPAGIKFSHKIGEGGPSKTYLDSGIVYVSNRPYLLTVVIAGRDEAEVKEIMREISQTVYDYVANY